MYNYKNGTSLLFEILTIFYLNTTVTSSGCRKTCQTHKYRNSIIHRKTGNNGDPTQQKTYYE